MKRMLHGCCRKQDYNPAQWAGWTLVSTEERRIPGGVSCSKGTSVASVVVWYHFVKAP